MSTNSFCTNFLNTPQGSGTSGQNSRDILDSSLRNPRKRNFRGRARTFRPPPLRVEDPHPPGGLRTPKVSLCALLLSEPAQHINDSIFRECPWDFLAILFMCYKFLPHKERAQRTQVQVVTPPSPGTIPPKCQCVLVAGWSRNRCSWWPLRFAVLDAAVYRGLYFVSCLFQGVSDTIAPLSRG